MNKKHKIANEYTPVANSYLGTNPLSNPGNKITKVPKASKTGKPKASKPSKPWKKKKR